MSIFDGYKAFNFDEGVPYVSVTKNGVTFNKAVIMKLGYPKHVLLLINSSEHKLAIKVCDERTPNQTTFYKANDKKILSVRWNARDLLNTIQDMMSWNLAMTSFRIDGILIPEESAMLFDLNSARQLQ